MKHITACPGLKAVRALILFCEDKNNMDNHTLGTPENQDSENHHQSRIVAEQLQLETQDNRTKVARCASKLAVIGYESSRLGYEVCFGLLPEAYD